MNIQSTINPLASADAGGTAGHDAAACVSARGKFDGASVCDARDARMLQPPTTLSFQARQVVAPQAQNSGTGAAVIALVPQPSTIKNAGADASKVSISKRSVRFAAAPPVDDDEGWTKCLGKTAQGRARRSAVCGTSAPPVLPSAGVTSLDAVAPSDPSVRPSAGVTSFDAVAPSVTPSVPSAAVPLPPDVWWEGLSYDRNGMLVPPSIRAVPSAVAPSVTPSVALPASPGGVAPGNAASPAVYSVSPTTIPQAASTNDLPIPAGAAAASTNESTSKVNDPKSISTNESTPKINDPELISSIPTSTDEPTFEILGALSNPSNAAVDRPVKSGIKPNAAAGTKARPANTTIFNDDTSSNSDLSTTKVKGSKKRLREKKKENLSTDDGIKALPVLAPSADHETLTPEEECDYIASRLEPIIYQEYDGLHVYTAEEDRAYKRAQELEASNSNYFYPVYTFATGPEAAPTLDGSEPSTPLPLTHVPRWVPPQTPRMSRLEKEAAKNARNTPKTVSISPTLLPQVVEADQAPTAGIPPVPDPLEPTIFPQVVETGDVRGAAMPPVTPEPTISPLETFPPAQVPLTGAQTTAANTTRNLALKAARLFGYRQGLLRVNLDRLELEAVNIAARASITTKTTLSQHERLRKRNLAALSNANSELFTFKATTLKDARILAIHVSVARRVSQQAPSVLRTSVVQELNSHLLCVTEDRLTPSSLKKLFHHLSQTAPSSLNLGKPGLSAKKPARKRM